MESKKPRLQSPSLEITGSMPAPNSGNATASQSPASVPAQSSISAETNLKTRPPPLQPQDLIIQPRAPLLVAALAAQGLAQGLSSQQHGTDQSQEDASGSVSEIQFFMTEDHPLSKKGFRYSHCCGMPFLNKVLYCLAEVEPYCARISYEDRSPNVYITKDALACTTTSGYRSARANVGVSSGKWYLEFEILNANNNSNIGTSDNSKSNDEAHVRIGWTRREASLETPVGHDAYGYGLRDVTGEKVYLSRPKPFMHGGFTTGDVIGLLIDLPTGGSATEDGSAAENNGALDNASTTTTGSQASIGKPAFYSDIVRDRIPIRYKGQLLFEILDYVPIKPMDELILPTNLFKRKRENYVPPSIPGSSIRVFKNGRDMGVAFENLTDFRPPNSKYPGHVAKSGNSTADDGQLGYYPTISVFRGGIAKFNFGPDFLKPPEGVTFGSGAVKPMSDRYDEQIAEDIVYDIIDQVEWEVIDGKVGESS